MKKTFRSVLCTALILPIALTGCAFHDSGNGYGENRNAMDGSSENSLENGGISDGGFSGLNGLAIRTAVYPEMAPYPDWMSYINSNGEMDDSFNEAYDAWWEDIKVQRNQPEGYAEGLEGFFNDSIRQFLSGSQGQNRVYSPLNVCMALGMLAEVTDGRSREQILTLLGSDDMNALRSQARAIWNANYRNDGVSTTILASSLWLNENVNFTQSTLDSLADNYYASSYQGTMGSPELDRALQAWLNEQTGGLLKDQTSQVNLNPETIMALAATISFHAKWHNEFSESRTEKGVFHGANGDINCDFMHQGGSRTYYWGEQFSAVAQGFENGGGMWFILPDEGVSVDELLQDKQVMKFILTNEWEDSKYLIVNLSVPKFDVASDMDLVSGLKALGVTDIFDSEVSDFSPMTADTEEIYLSQAMHAARVMIDEEGCTAVAYTVMPAAGAAMPPDEEIDFILDRPFLFVITGSDNLPLFVGVVNQPIDF